MRQESGPAAKVDDDGKIFVANVTFERLDGTSVTCSATSGTTLMRVAVDNDVPGIEGECGGELSCATCHVHVAPEWRDRLPERSEEEAELLEMVEDLRDDSRLACQIRLGEDHDGLTVTVPEP
jgi:ferredoxin, 2Fe-2S